MRHWQNKIFAAGREIIVVDNTAGGITCKNVSEYSGVQLVQGPFEGRAHARNVAITKAKGDILLFCDADCQPEKDWITRLMGPFKTHSDMGSVAGDISYVKINNMVGRYYQFKAPFTMRNLIESGLLKVPPVMSNVAYRKVIFQDLGLFDVAFGNACEDFGLWQKINQGKKFQTVSLSGATIYYINQDIGSIGRNYFDFHVGLQYWCLFYEDRRKEYKFQLPSIALMGLFPFYVIAMPFRCVSILFKRGPLHMAIFPLFELIEELAVKLGAEDRSRKIFFKGLTRHLDGLKRLKKVLASRLKNA